MSFLGEYDINMDAKGRFLLPQGYRKQLPEGEHETEFVLSRSFDGCLAFYTISEWQKFAAKINKLNEMNPRAFRMKRALLSGASKIELDSAGRVLIPKSLQEYAGLTKQMIFTAVGNKMELWDKEKYTLYITAAQDDMAGLADELLGGEILDPFDS